MSTGVEVNFEMHEADVGKKFITEVYESPLAKDIFGDTFRPGGLQLTTRAADVADVNKTHLVLDIACGEGATVGFLALQYKCRVFGIDFSRELLVRAQHSQQGKYLSEMVDFVQGDAEELPFTDETFDVIISECSFSLLPDKKTAAFEFNRVLKPGGKLVITDVVLWGQIEEELQNQATFAMCVAGAKSLEDYVNLFQQTCFITYCIEDHSAELRKLARAMLMDGSSAKAFFALSHQAESKKIWRRLFNEGKPGYALIAMTKL